MGFFYMKLNNFLPTLIPGSLAERTPSAGCRSLHAHFPSPSLAIHILDAFDDAGWQHGGINRRSGSPDGGKRR